MKNVLSKARPASSPEKALWVGVIFQAVKDAARLRKLEARYLRYVHQGKKLPYYLEPELNAAHKAMTWLTQPSGDLRLVCELAGMDVTCILSKAGEFKAGKFELLEPLLATHELQQ